MNNLLERLGGFAARRYWIFIIAWLVILGGTLWARHASGGEFVNNYSVSGSGSALGQDLLNKDYPQQGGYAGQIVFHAKSGTASADQAAVNRPPATWPSFPT
jgi:RND superfamily putative drug exporter